tara:strand:- start:96363 stop:96650 length:288 start_codon:yes stop_codon:yes gene_type:complete
MNADDSFLKVFSADGLSHYYVDILNLHSNPKEVTHFKFYHKDVSRLQNYNGTPWFICWKGREEPTDEQIDVLIGDSYEAWFSHQIRYDNEDMRNS